MTLQGSYEVAAALMVARGVLIGYAIGVWATLMMEWVPEGKLARVTSLDFFGAIGLLPVGYALTALVSQTADAATILTVGFTLAELPLGDTAALPPRAYGGLNTDEHGA